MLNNLNRLHFLNLVNKRKYNTEDEIEQYCFENLSNLLNIDKLRIKRQKLTTPFDFTLSNRGDLFIYSENDSDQIIVVFEIKLDSSIIRFDNGSYVNATKQLHKYCQDVNSPYGILLSDKQCFIYEYKYNGSTVNPISINSLPPIEEIEKELIKNAKLHDLSVVAKGIEEIREHQKNDSIKKDENNKVETPKLKKEINKSLLLIVGCSIVIGFVIYVLINLPKCEEIKGNITVKDGIVTKIYHDKNSSSYDKTKINVANGDKIFCTIKEAEKAGFRKYKNY